MVGLMVTSSKRTYATHGASQVCYSQSPCSHTRPLLTHASAGAPQTVKVMSVSVSYGVLLFSLHPGAHKVLSVLSKHLWRVWGLILNAIAPSYHLLQLLLCPWMRGIFFWWVPAFSCLWLFSSSLPFWCSRRRWGGLYSAISVPTWWYHGLVTRHIAADSSRTGNL